MNGPELPPALRESATARLLAAADGERSGVCEQLAREHPAHRAALQRLLRRIGGAERLLAESFPAPALASDPPAIAGHRVVRRLGQGAFGTVYLCAQEHPVARPVAIKVIRTAEGDLLRRFHAERQVLASLSHPAIAQIHDAGSLPDGRPFFVMEFVDGRPITEYCRGLGLSPEQSVRLFVDLCHGVDHAHGRGIVHRDLKPANVLVVESGGRPQPKIIDFGIAKALQSAGRAEGTEAMTEHGRVMGTPGYMSPEQAAGQVDRIDARTDVFALGVLLYELLTGELPWPRRSLHETTTEPARPSARITRSARRSGGDDHAAARRLAARVRGDLDRITLKAVHRDPAQRYAGARELAEDLARHLAGQPVLAAPPSLGYRLRKLVRRHRVATLTSAAAFAAVVTGVAVNWRARDAVQAAAARRVEAAAAVAALLQRANDASLRRLQQHEALRTTLAADALAFYERWLAERPDDREARIGRCRALTTLAEVRAVLGQLAAATAAAREAAEEAEQLLAPAPDDVALLALRGHALRLCVRALHLGEDHAGSLSLCERAVADFERCAAAAPAAHGIALAQSLRDLSLSQQALGNLDASEASCRRAIATLEDLATHGLQPAALSPDLVWARFTLAGLRMKARAFDEAESLLAACEAGLADVIVDRLRTEAVVRCQQGQVALARGDAAAVPRIERALVACEAWVQQEPGQYRAHTVRFECSRDLARAREARSDWDAAQTAMQQTIAAATVKATAFPESPDRVHDQRVALYEFARALWNRYRRQDLAQASAWLQQCLDLADAAVAARGRLRPLRWEVRSVAALVGDADGQATVAMWDLAATELPRGRDLGPEEPAQQAVEGWLGVARNRFRRGDLAGVRDALAQCAHYSGGAHAVDANLRSEVAYWRARLHLADGDTAAAAAAIAEITSLRRSWWGAWRAGDCEFSAWRMLARPDGSGPAAAHRDRAAAAYRAVAEHLAPRVAQAPDDPWLAVPWGLASVGLALLEAEAGDSVAAQARLLPALGALERVAAAAHRDLWDEERVAAGRALAQRLATAGNR